MRAFLNCGVPTPARLAFVLALLVSTGCMLLDPGKSGWSGSASSTSADPSQGAFRAVPPDAAGVAKTRDAEPSSAVVGSPALWAHWNKLRGDAYELDSVDRFLETPTKRLQCDRSNLVTYPGTAIRYHGPVTVNAPFRERLERFEKLVIETAEEVYGRAPKRIVHLGAYSCRSSRNRNYRVSEHALGNAIDVAGFDFGVAPKASALPVELPRQLRGSFEVRVAKHWNPKANASPGSRPEPNRSSVNSAAAVHARFLDLLTHRLSKRPDIFRGMIGPSRPDHGDHLHLDVSPWRYVWL